MAAHRRDCVIIGAGHNGLIAGCYLALAGLDVEIVERDGIAGGAVSTVERWPDQHPGVRVDRGSSLHVMFRHTGIAEELDLPRAGLHYFDADPFVVLPDQDRGSLVLQRDLDATCAHIERIAGAESADGYHRIIEEWTPRWRSLLALADATNPLQAARSMWPTAREQWRLGLELSRQFLTSADDLIDTRIPDERLGAAVAWWAAQAGPAPHETGTAPIAGSLALMHQISPGRPRGGSGGLTDALITRFTASGGTLRLGDGASRIDVTSGGVTAVVTASGDRIPTDTVIAACHASTTMQLLGRNDLARRVRTGDGIGFILRLLADTPPRYAGDDAPADRGMTFLVNSRQQIRVAAADALAGIPSRIPPQLVMTPTLADQTLAPTGRHVVTVWSQWAPYRLADGTWESRRNEVAESVLDATEAWAPGLRDSVIDAWIQTPADLESELGLIRGDVMHVMSGLDTIFGLRPLPGWSRRTPIDNLYLAGASTHPGGGVWGASGRAAAHVLLSDRHRLRNRLARASSAAWQRSRGKSTPSHESVEPVRESPS